MVLVLDILVIVLEVLLLVLVLGIAMIDSVRKWKLICTNIIPKQDVRA